MLWGLPLSLFSAQTAREKRLEKQVHELNDEIKDLGLSIQSLELLSERLKKDSDFQEENFKSTLSSLVVHLIQWPEKRWGMTASSWTELQRANLVLENVRQSLLRTPLEMMANRELRLSEIEGLARELENQKKEVESKHAMLDVQLKELQKLKPRGRSRPPQARGHEKKNLEVVD